MKKLACVVGTLAALICASFVAASNPAGARVEDGVPSIKDVMQQLHKGADAPIKSLAGALKEESPNWAAIKPQAKIFEALGAALPKNDPPVGSKESWEKLALSYYDNAKDLNKAVVAENQEAALDAHGTLAKSCAACHKVHRE